MLADTTLQVTTVQPIDATLPILLFIFACLVFPKMVRNHQQFYAALGTILFRLLIACVAAGLNSDGLRNVSGGLGGLLEIIAILLLVMSVGGLSPKELASGFTDAYEAIRHPEHNKPTVVPMTGEKPRPKADEDDAPKVYTINTPKDHGSVPME